MNHQLQLAITVRQNHTVLPRCLQVLSRRGFKLITLTTKELDTGDTVLNCTLIGPPQWHSTLPQLLYKIIDVKKVETL